MEPMSETELAPGAERVEGRLPNFIVIGVTKGGTTSLHQYLAPHPEVYLVPGKELHFFDREYDRGPDWYRRQFAGAGDQKIVGEMTPEYLAFPQAAERAAALVPGAKLAVILRHPVDRAYSHYWMQRSKFTSKESFEVIIRLQMADPEATPPRPHLLYLSIGRYIEHLERLTKFYPRESILVLIMDDLKRDPAGVYASLCTFLGIDGRREPQELGAVFNATTDLRSQRLRRLMLRKHAWKHMPRLATTIDRLNRTDGYPPLRPELRAELLHWYRPYNAALAGWLGRDLSAWER
jgi:hypothetical protein